MSLNENKKIINFEVEKAEIIDENPDSRFLTARIQAFASSENRHSMICSEKVLENTASSIYDVPVIYNIVKYLNDFGSHVSPENSLICGFVVPNSAEFERLDDGRLALFVRAKISKRYSPKVIEILQRDKGEKKISVEMSLDESEEREDGLLEMKSYTYLACCLIGNSITEASPSAHLEVLSFASENNQIRKEYELEFSNKYYGIDFTIPEKIKKNAQKSLKSYKEKGSNATSISLAMARFLTNNEKITPEKIKMMAKFFNRKIAPDEIIMGFYGGREGAKWSKEMNESINEIDNKQLSYFGKGEVVTFPYKSMKEVNPALKGIDPPLNLSQMNEIATQADSIGGDYGWPTAIKSWKSRHKIEKGHWVKKENSTEKEEKFVNEDNEKLEEMSEIPVEKDMATEDIKDPEVEMSEKPVEEMAKEDVKVEDKEDPKDKVEDKVDDKGEVKEEKMSLDGNLDVAAMLAILEDETEGYRELVDQHKRGEMDYSKLSMALYNKMCKMSEASKLDKDAYMSENEGLKKFKSDVEDKQFAFEVESTLAEVSDTMPKDKVNEYREDSKNFSLETIDGWKNKVKAIAFSYTKDKKPSDGITRIAMAWIDNSKKESNFDNGWL
jgi:hypothetical protein